MPDRKKDMTRSPRKPSSESSPRGRSQSKQVATDSKHDARQRRKDQLKTTLRPPAGERTGGRRQHKPARDPAQDLAQAGERLRLAARITGTIVGSQPLPQQAREMAEQVRQTFGVDACVIRLLEGDQLVLLASAGLTEADLPPRIHADTGASHKVIATRRPVFIQDVRAATISRACIDRRPSAFPLVSYAGTPLLAQDRVIGIFGIYASRRLDSFTLTDLEYLQMFANYISAAVVNDRLYQELKTQKERMEREVAERARAEQALRDSEERYRRVVEDQTEFIVRWLPDGTRTFVNESYARYFGIPRGQLVGANFLSLVAQQDRQSVRRKIASFTPERAVQTDEHRVVLPGGEIGWNEWTDRAIFDAEGQVVEFQSVGRDITERKRLQQQLLQAQKMESIGTLAGGIAHDFGNLLAVIMGNVSILQRQPGISAKARDLLTDIAMAAERGSAFTQQLLAYARGGSRQRAWTDLNELVRLVVRMLDKTTPEGIDYGLRLSSELPKVLVDSTQIEQVLMNLCLNAIQACQPPARVEITTVQEKLDRKMAEAMELTPSKYVCLQVKDTGCGMPEEVAERVFEPFFTTKPMGRGMGLATAIGILEAHRGKIRVHSAPGAGTTVSVWLPVSEPPSGQ